MHQVHYVDVSIGSSDGSTQCQSTVPMRLSDSLGQKFPLDATTSLDVGDQQGPSHNTTSHMLERRVASNVKVAILEQYMWLARDHFPLPSWWIMIVFQSRYRIL